MSIRKTSLVALSLYVFPLFANGEGVRLPALADCRKGTDIVLVGEVEGRRGLYGQVLNAKNGTKGDAAVKEATAVTELIPLVEDANLPQSMAFVAENENDTFRLEIYLGETQSDLEFKKEGTVTTTHYYHCKFHTTAFDIKPNPSSKAVNAVQDMIYNRDTRTRDVSAALDKLSAEKFVNPGAISAVLVSAKNEKSGTVATYLVSATYSQIGEKAESKSLLTLVKVWDGEEMGEVLKVVPSLE